MTTLRRWTTLDSEHSRFAASISPDLQRQTGGTDLSTTRSTARYIEEHLIRQRADVANYAISVDGAAVGNVGISRIEHTHGTAWTYYWVSADMRGQGLATRALASVADLAFRELELFRLELGHRVENPASCVVAVRAGFLTEGIERKRLTYGDERFDVETHSRLATDEAVPVKLLPIEN